MAEFFVGIYNPQKCNPKMSYVQDSSVVMMMIKESINIKGEKEKKEVGWWWYRDFKRR